jgi:hypothetical protein
MDGGFENKGFSSWEVYRNPAGKEGKNENRRDDCRSDQ